MSASAALLYSSLSRGCVCCVTVHVCLHLTQGSTCKCCIIIIVESVLGPLLLTFSPDSVVSEGNEGIYMVQH